MRLRILRGFPTTLLAIDRTSPGTLHSRFCEPSAALTHFRTAGRPGRVEGTRELVLAPLPFVAVYEVLENEVQVLRILHGAQQWPPP
jgi:toxin ParE1/3/4